MSSSTALSDQTAPKRSALQFINNLPLAVSISIPPVFVVIIALIIGLVGASSARTLAQGQNDMYEGEVVPFVSLYDMQREYQGSRVRALALLAYQGQDISDKLAELDEREQQTLGFIDDYRNLTDNPADADAIEAEVIRFHELVRTGLAPLVQSDNVNQSAITSYWENILYPASDVVNELMTKESRDRDESATERFEAGSALATSNQTTLVLTIIIGVILGLILTSYGVRRIRKTITNAAESVHALAR